MNHEDAVDESKPIFLQIAQQLEGEILDGTLPEESQVPSINELAVFHRINPATALKGINLLVDAGVLYKRRGIGMFVAQGARARLLQQRQATFQADYIRPVAQQARALGLTASQIDTMMREEMGP